MYRLINDEISCFIPAVGLTGEQRTEVLLQESASYGLCTKYIRSIFFATTGEHGEHDVLTTAVSLNTEGEARPETFSVMSKRHEGHLDVYAWIPADQFPELTKDKAKNVSLV